MKNSFCGDHVHLSVCYQYQRLKLSSNFHDIRYRVALSKVVEQACVLLKCVQWESYFTKEPKSISTCTFNISSLLSILLDRFEWNSMQRDLPWCPLAVLSFPKIGVTKAILCLRAQNVLTHRMDSGFCSEVANTPFWILEPRRWDRNGYPEMSLRN